MQVDIEFRLTERVLVRVTGHTGDEVHQGIGVVQQYEKQIMGLEQLGSMALPPQVAVQQTPPQQVAPSPQQQAPQVQAYPSAEPEPRIGPGGAPRPQVPIQMCPHGPRRWLSGVGGNGNAYAFFGCQAPKGSGQCKHLYPSDIAA